MGEEVLYSVDKVNGGSDEDDIWDDTLLIKAYDKAINSTKKKIAAQIYDGENSVSDSDEKISKQGKLENGATVLETRRKTIGNKENGAQHSDEKNAKQVQNGISIPEKCYWKVGMPCRSIFSDDGLEYEATLKSVDAKRGTCEVVYIGYNNEEEVHLKTLKPSHGARARRNQQNSRGTSMDSSNGWHRYRERFTPDAKNNESFMIPPPPPPQVMGNFPTDEEDAFSAMMMAWYMSGYHTGYYQGLTRAKCNHKSYQVLNGAPPSNK